MIVQLVTQRTRLSSSADPATQRQCLRLQVEQAVAAGIDLIQVREPDLDARAATALVRDLVDLARGSSSRILVNDRLDVALAAGAHGVHLPSRGLPSADVRRVVGDAFIIGVSVHDVRDLTRADGADYVVAGTVWASNSKPEGHSTIGVEGLRRIVAASPAPVLAIGGVTVEHVRDVADAGAAGVAAIGLFIDIAQSSDCHVTSLQQCVNDLRRRFDTPRSGS